MDDGLFLLIILLLAVVIILDYYFAKWFYEVAEKKGFYDEKYFWICFLLGFGGYLLVIALPDRGNIQNDEIVSDQLPDL